jgi:hypothetical protein
MVAKRSRWPTPQRRRLELDSQSADESVRGDGVRGLCPCHAGWEVFEQNVSVVFRRLRDRSRVVRAHALHVIEDAARMQVMDDLQYYIAPGENKIGEKRARGRSMAERLEARRNRKLRKSNSWHRSNA